MTTRRWILYLLLNALVSAAISGTILYIYHQTNLNKECATIETISTLSSGGINVAIINVSGRGTLDSEAILIQNNSAEAVQMGGWMIKDSQGITFIFPHLTLYPGGTVKVHSGSGVYTSKDLFWERTEPVWESGELVALYDMQNIARAFYRVP